MFCFGVCCVLSVAAGYYILSGTTFEITVQEDGLLIFRTLRGRVLVAAHAIKEIRYLHPARNLIKVVYENGSLYVPTQVTDVQDLIATLKSMNPSLQINEGVHSRISGPESALAKTYKLPRDARLNALVIIALLIAGAFGAAVPELIHPRSQHPRFSFWFALLWLLGVGWKFYEFSGTAFEVTVQSNDSIVFRTLRGRVLVATQTIRSIRRLRRSRKLIKVIYAGGVVYIPAQINDLENLIETIKTMNPAVQIQH